MKRYEKDEARKLLQQPTRRALLKLLFYPQSTQILSDKLDLKLKNCYYHLTLLREAGLITRESEKGRELVEYKITEKGKTALTTVGESIDAK